MKATILSLLLLSFTSIAFAQASEDFIGRWEIKKVMKSDKDITEKANPHDERWLELHADGNYHRGGQPEGDDSGTWSFAGSTHTISLVSSSSNQTENWTAATDGEDMVWKGQGSRRQARLEFTFVRADLAP